MTKEDIFVLIKKINKLSFGSLTQILVEDSLEELLFLATALLFLAALGVSPGNLIKILITPLSILKASLNPRRSNSYSQSSVERNPIERKTL
ncbi:hypothetical protein BpHYR1_000562 [Brachionus plicatilis]|uniref:Uncharacterized protein n=1 Tax=Brachionus plicatilis TaxID=10195 RepID=A0A3M7R4H2_BRAPC|nr:hypothetical protein BpHYR1_000562 [Brachionus plicatilis]